MVEKTIYNWLKIAAIEFADESRANLSLDLIEEEVNELKDATNRKDILDAYVDIIWVLNNFLYAKGIQIKEIKEYIKKVQISNFSKFCLSKEEAQKTVEAYRNGEHPDKIGVNINARYMFSKPYYIILDEKGKILKNINYIKV